MNFRYSKLIERATYKTEGLCNGIALRMHKQSSLEKRGALRAQEDWSKLVGPVGHYHGHLGPRFDFAGVCLPECRPERFEIVSYATEHFFMFDGKVCL